MWAPLEGHSLELGSSALKEQTAGGCLLTALSVAGRQVLVWKGIWTIHLCFNHRETDLVIKMITVAAGREVGPRVSCSPKVISLKISLWNTDVPVTRLILHPQ